MKKTYEEIRDHMQKSIELHRELEKQGYAVSTSFNDPFYRKMILKGTNEQNRTIVGYLNYDLTITWNEDNNGFESTKTAS